MQSSNAPNKIKLPFAASGTKNTIPVPSQIAITPGAASYTDGFPPLTFTPKSAGGIPPAGADINGVLNAITALQQWQSSGGLFQYDAAQSASIGGYPLGAMIVNAAKSGFWVSTVENNTTNPDAGGAGWVGFSPSMTIAQLGALTADQGPIICRDQPGIYMWNGTAYVPQVPSGQTGIGQCRLSVYNSTTLLLSPYGGRNIVINGITRQIQTAGVTITNAGLSANTLYYVYATWTGTTIALNLSTTGHGTLLSGIEVKSTDAASSLVAMVYTSSTANFVDAPSQRFCLNFFNRRAIASSNTLAANRSTTSTSLVEISPTERAQFMSWADETTMLSASVIAYQNTSGSFSTQLNIDGTVAASNATISPPNGQASAAGSFANVVLAEGMHYLTIFGNATAGYTATWPANINSVSALIRG